ncbi:unnamed protein product, partial [Mesorhabditis spiculigera]
MDYDALLEEEAAASVARPASIPDIAEVAEGIRMNFARLLVAGGWAEAWGVEFEHLFGSTPLATSKEAIASFPRHKFDELAEKQKDGQCLVCLDAWKNEADKEILELPCRHFFHSDCILMWLEKANSCPACRHRLPTDNENFNEYQRQLERREARQRDVEELHDSMFS